MSRGRVEKESTTGVSSAPGAATAAFVTIACSASSSNQAQI